MVGRLPGAVQHDGGLCSGRGRQQPGATSRLSDTRVLPAMPTTMRIHDTYSMNTILVHMLYTIVLCLAERSHLQLTAIPFHFEMLMLWGGLL